MNSKWQHRLDQSINSLFTPIDDNGFWDNNEKKIIRSLEYEFTTDGICWRPDDSFHWRYSPFALMGIMYWRSSPIGNSKYDSKIYNQFKYFLKKLEDTNIKSVPSYGMGPLIMSLSFAEDIFPKLNAEEKALNMAINSKNPSKFNHNEDALLLFGWAHIYERTNDAGLRKKIEEGLEHYSSLFSGNLFTYNSINRDYQKYNLGVQQLYDLLYGGSPTRRHQNQMYILWGLSKASEVLDDSSNHDKIENVIEYSIRHRMREDGAFIWEDVSKFSKMRGELLFKLGIRPPHWHFLYECHQTFFINAVSTYYSSGGTNVYNEEVKRAADWIYNNSLYDCKYNIDVPMRQITINGDMCVSDQMYKGTYEIGSYIMALTDIVNSKFGF